MFALVSRLHCPCSTTVQPVLDSNTIPAREMDDPSFGHPFLYPDVSVPFASAQERELDGPRRVVVVKSRKPLLLR